MNVRTHPWLLATILMLVVTVGCSPAAAPPTPSSPGGSLPSPSPPTPTGKSAIDYAALEAEIEKAITAGSATLDNVRAVLINVNGEPKIAHYRHGFSGTDHGRRRSDH